MPKTKKRAEDSSPGRRVLLFRATRPGLPPDRAEPRINRQYTPSAAASQMLFPRIRVASMADLPARPIRHRHPPAAVTALAAAKER
jgi:hypothetical protein